MAEDWLGTVDPETRDALLAAPPLDLSDLATARAGAAERAAALRTLLPPAPGVSTRDVLVPGLGGAPDVRARLYEPDGRERPGGVVVFVHGGGMVLGTAEASDPLCELTALEQGCLVVSVDYRLAPETRAPGAAEDVLAVLRWTRDAADELAVDPARTVLLGASAGGGLAAAAALLAQERGGPPPALLLLVFPMLDDRTDDRLATDERTWNGEANRVGWQALLGSACGSDGVPATWAPGRATVEQLRGLPPTYLDVGDHDLFRDEDVAFAQRLMSAGVPCELHVTPGAWHASEYAAPGAGSSQRILRHRREALARALAPCPVGTVPATS